MAGTAHRDSGVTAPETPPQPTTTRVGSSRRPWLVALATVVALGAIVYLGLSGPRATPVQTPSAVAAAPSSPPPTPRPSRNTSFPPDEIVAIRIDPDAPVIYQYLGTGLTIGGRGTLAILDPVRDGADHYRGAYRIPLDLLASPVRLEFDAVSASVSHDDLDRIGEWTFPISIAGIPAITVLDTGGTPTDRTLTNPEFNRLMTEGYRLTVSMSDIGDAWLMTIDVFVGEVPAATASPSSPSPTR